MTFQTFTNTGPVLIWDQSLLLIDKHMYIVNVDHYCGNALLSSKFMVDNFMVMLYDGKCTSNIVFSTTFWMF
jgi:hypothetical protein